MLALPNGRFSLVGAMRSASSKLFNRVDSADFSGNRSIVTIGTTELDDPFSVTAADDGCDMSFS